MMFKGERDSIAISIFKWKRQSSSLTSRLLDDVHPEIELSDYRRAPSPGSESPSGLLDDERLNIEPISDLDLFFERLYSYYCQKGLWCIIIKWIIELLSVAFTICFSVFFLLYVDWDGLLNAKCGTDAVEPGSKPCDLLKEFIHQHPLTPLTFSKAIIVGYLGIFSIYLIFCFVRFFTQLKATLSIRQFYYNSLHVTDNEIQTMPWESILEKVVQLQNSQRLCVVKDLSIHDVVMRLMRKENYLIGMMNKGVLAFPITFWVPGAGPIITCGPNGARYRLILPKTLEWTLNWCILQSMFDRNFCIKREFISDPNMLRKRLMIVGFVMLLLSPFLIIFMLVYLFLRHAEQLYRHPHTASSRRWSNLAKWMYREFNEVEHLFKHRINSSLVHASNYIKQFPSPILSVVARFISFVSGGFAAVLIIVAFLDESLLEGHIFGRNLIWYAAVFGSITAISRAAVNDELLVLDPQGTMSLVVQHTHYMPKKWRGKENCDSVRGEFETLFQYTGMMLLEDMASIFLTPYLLLFVVPKRVDDILQFIADFTSEVEGVGHVCSFSIFDFQKHGNGKYGSPINTSRIQRSSQGKMEKSFLSFQSSYPSWEPNDRGRQFLATLKTFGEQRLQGQLTGYTGLPSGVQQWNTNSGVGDGPTRKMPFNGLGTGYQVGSTGMMNGELHNYPYILDCYYVFQSHHDPRNVPSRLSDPGEDQDCPGHFWIRTNIRENEAMNDETWGHLSEDRAHSNLGASTSAPFFQESILQHQDPSDVVPHPTRSHWWDRNQTQGTDQLTSFLEPPNYAHNPSLDHYNNFPKRDNLESSTSTRAMHNLESSTSTHILQQSGVQHHELSGTPGPTGSQWWVRGQPTTPAPHTSFLQPPNFTRSNHAPDYHDNISERSIEEQEDHLDWRNSNNRLSKTFYMDDLDGGDLDLPFDDIYQKNSEGPSDSWNKDPLNRV